jgi:hypothetical protein
MDFFKKIGERARKVGEESEAEARKKYGEDYEKAGTLGRGVMRGISSGVFGEGASSPFSFQEGAPGSEMDLERFVSLKPIMPQGANPMQLYGNLYGAYGGRKTRGLLFD